MIITSVTNIGDPYVLLDGDTYYMYATSHAAGFKVFISKNLKDWDDAGLCYFDSTWGYKDFWAPEVIKRNGRYYMYFTARDREKDSLRMGVAVSDSPFGRFRDIDGNPVFDFGYAAIDGTVFTDDDGQDYLYFSRDCSENIVDGIHISELYVVKLNKDLVSYSGIPRKITTPDAPYETSDPGWRWNEGPAMLKHRGKYYLSYSANCYNNRGYSVCYAVSDAPDGRFVKAEENPILRYIEGKISGPGHNAYFTDRDGNLMTAFHIHTDYDNPSGDRRACFSKAGFSDGKLKIYYK
jgi:Beta-xylosidase